ncbi:hypothetical protein ACFSDD_09250 [Salipiger marinus]|uniref:hypothetical protein n=1 Tax=Salipiger marinus TaxID=555512 RepID=UPI002CDB6665|nr:hypothetical protein [Salipiger manganoxidans]MEB3422228.1 hypothetical protein [Salipiger manganoxidans]
MRTLSLNARRAREGLAPEEVEVLLIEVTHPDLEAPIRLSTDPTERISTDPLVYGTRSGWRGANPVTEPFLFALISAEVPGDMEEAPASATLVLENVDHAIAELLRSVTSRASVHLAVVLAASPEVVEAEFLDMQLIAAEGDAERIPLTISRQPIEEEGFPMHRMTRDRFPGMFR